MVDFENLPQRPEPFFTEATRQQLRSRKPQRRRGLVRQWRRRPIRAHRNERRPQGACAGRSQRPRHDHAVLVGQSRPDRAVTRFYFDGETQPRFEVPLADLFTRQDAAVRPGVLVHQRNRRQPLLSAALRQLAQDHDRGEGRADRSLLRNRLSHLSGGNAPSRRSIRNRPAIGRTCRRKVAQALSNPETGSGARRIPMAHLSPDDSARRDAEHARGARRKGRLRVVRPGARYAREPETGTIRCALRTPIGFCFSTSVSTARRASRPRWATSSAPARA